MTWPLVPGLGRDIPWDLGDSLLNCWIIGWVDDHVLRFLSGDLHAFRGFWTANIYHGEPLTLAYSEHLVAPALQVLPIYAATKNLILCYDLLFFASFVLSGFGVYLLVRELTGRPAAAFVAGLIYAFAPYRIGQFSHLQALSSQWMPFALYGFRRYFESLEPSRVAQGFRLRHGSGGQVGPVVARPLRALAGATAATIAQNLSCGYFMVFFAPFVSAYVLYEIIERGLWSRIRVWRDLAIAGAVVAAATWPFVAPYLELRRLGFPRRPLEEVMLYSADVYSYLTAHGAQKLYGEWLRAFPKPEGDSFTAFVPLLLAAVGIVAHVIGLWRRTRGGADPPSSDSARGKGPLDFAQGKGLRPLVWALAAVLAVNAIVLVAITATAGFFIPLGPLSIRASNVRTVVLRILIAAPILLVLSPRACAMARGVPRSALAFYAAAFAAAFSLSLGPSPTSMGRRIVGGGLYWYFYEYVPGFDGLRVPARLGMIVMLFLSVLAGYGAAWMEGRWRRGAAVVLALGVVFLIEATAVPVEMNGSYSSADFMSPPSRILPAERAPQVYRFLPTLPESAVLAEFPFGDDAHELRYMYYSTVHWRRLLNGYSGGFPDSYLRRRAALRQPVQRPEVAAEVLAESGATHAVVHEGLFKGEEGVAVSTWLIAHGAQQVGQFGRDRVFALRPR